MRRTAARGDLRLMVGAIDFTDRDWRTCEAGWGHSACVKQRTLGAQRERWRVLSVWLQTYLFAAKEAERIGYSKAGGWPPIESLSEADAKMVAVMSEAYPAPPTVSDYQVMAKIIRPLLDRWEAITERGETLPTTEISALEADLGIAEGHASDFGYALPQPPPTPPMGQADPVVGGAEAVDDAAKAAGPRVISTLKWAVALAAIGLGAVYLGPVVSAAGGLTASLFRPRTT